MEYFRGNIRIFYSCTKERDTRGPGVVIATVYTTRHGVVIATVYTTRHGVVIATVYTTRHGVVIATVYTTRQWGQLQQ